VAPGIRVALTLPETTLTLFDAQEAEPPGPWDKLTDTLLKGPLKSELLNWPFGR